MLGFQVLSPHSSFRLLIKTANKGVTPTDFSFVVLQATCADSFWATEAAAAAARRVEHDKLRPAQTKLYRGAAHACGVPGIHTTDRATRGRA
jgi:hypothetical protein